MIPIAKIENRCSAPPENTLKSPRMPPWLLLNSSSSTVALMPGTGMCVPTRNTISAPSRNHRRRLRSASFPPDLSAGLLANRLILLSHRTARRFDRGAGALGREQTGELHRLLQLARLDHLR